MSLKERVLRNKVAQDSSKPEFWESRYRDHTIPWDAGKVPAQLCAYASSRATGTRILIPGCGSAYEAAYLAERSFDVLAVDFSAAAVAAAQRILGKNSAVVQLADFFTFNFGERFDVIYERAFLCALPRTLWRDYSRRCAELLRPQGVIAGFYFFAETLRGPPFGTSQDELDTLLSNSFKRVDDQPVTDSIDVFRGKERWQVWSKRT